MQVPRSDIMLPREGERMARREYQNPPLKKSKGARPFWYIRYRRKVLIGKGQIDRVQKQQSLGYCDEMGKREAERKREEILRQVNREVYTIQSHIPFSEFAAIWREKHFPNLGAGTRAKYQGHLAKHLLPEFGTMKLCDVETELIQDFLNRKERDGLAWWTRSDLRNILSSIFTKADDWGYWKDRNPVERCDLGRKRAKREKRLLTDAQFLQLLDAVPEFVALICQTADSTGLRISEILGLKWKNVDLVTGWLQVRERYYRGDQDDTKSEKSNRDVPLGYLVDNFRRLRPLEVSPEAYVFDRGDGNPHDDRALLKDFIRPAAKQLGFYWEGFGFHSLRRENITTFQEVGGSAIEAQKHAGHSRPTMTGEYTILQRKRQEDLVRKVQQRFEVLQ